MKAEGKVFYLDRSNIDTDQIISAKHLDVVSIKGLGPHLFEDLDLPGFSRDDPNFKKATILIARENFGSGSSREHAVWALEDHGIKAVVAPSFARIFRQNMFNRGLLAIELNIELVASIFNAQWENCRVDLETMMLKFWSGWDQNIDTVYRFRITDFQKELVLLEGLPGFLAKHY